VRHAYETLAIFDGVLPEEGVDKEVTAVKTLIEGVGTIVKIDRWGRRDLAYPIRKRRSGCYVLFVYEGETALPAKITKLVKLNENVLRHLTVLHDPAAKTSVPREALRIEMDTREEGGSRFSGGRMREDR
jgi:small subunit ribosomal protein S6